MYFDSMSLIFPYFLPTPDDFSTSSQITPSPLSYFFRDPVRSFTVAHRLTSEGLTTGTPQCLHH